MGIFWSVFVTAGAVSCACTHGKYVRRLGKPELVFSYASGAIMLVAGIWWLTLASLEGDVTGTILSMPVIAAGLYICHGAAREMGKPACMTRAKEVQDEKGRICAHGSLSAGPRSFRGEDRKRA